MRRTRPLAIVSCALLVTLLGALPAAARTARSTGGQASTAEGPTVQVGVNDVKDPTIAVLEFMPETVTVTVGETLTWSWDGTIEPHSVTFVPPGTDPPTAEELDTYLAPTPPTGAYDGTTVVNSGLLPLGTADVPPFSMSFGKVGEYKYYCVIHPKMIGTVDVVAEGEKVETPAKAAARGKGEQKRYLAEGRAAKAKLEKSVPKPKKAADGTTTYTVEMGITTEHTDILAFAAETTNMKAGDSVTFVNRSEAPHTATFAGQQEPLTNPIAPESESAIPGPSPQTLNGTDLFNTGTIPPNAGSPPPPAAARRYTYVVPTAGTYEYYCILHTLDGMTGKLTVKT